MEVDVWVGSLNQNKVIGILCTVDNLKRDIETKILIDCSDEEIKIILNKMKNPFMSAKVIFHKKD